VATEARRLPVTHPAAGLTADVSTLYRQIVEAAHEGVWLHDLDGVTTFANAQMADLVGYSLEEMCSVTLFDLLDEQGQQQAREMLERERRNPLTEQVDCRYVRKDGSHVWCLVNRSPLLDGDGRHIGCINLISDITERTLVDERLRRSGDLLEEAQRVAHLGSWSWDIPEDRLEWTDELYRILGIRDRIVPTYQGYLDQVHPEDRDTVNTRVLGCLAGHPEFSYEGRIIRPTGQVVWIHAQGRRIVDSAGVLRSLRGTVLDITAYKTAQEQALHTSSRYRLLQRMASAANSDMRFEQVLQLAVDEILLHSGWPMGRGYLVRGDPPQLVLAAPPPPSRQPGVPRQARGSSAAPGALSHRVLAAGRALWLTSPWSASEPSPDGPGQHPDKSAGALTAGFAFPVLVDGKVVAVLEFRTYRSVSADDELLETCEQVSSQLSRVVERQRAADDLAAAIDAALESLRAKSEFLATMSHEIRTPMNGVIGLTNLLLDTELDERQRQYAEGVHVSGEALLTVINDILDFSKLEAGKVELDHGDFDVRRIVEEVAALLAPTAYAKGVELLTHCLADVPAVLVGDSGRIRQVVLNLVSNGVKFTAAGEVVTRVTTAALSPGRVALRVEVSDTGIGIAEQSRERLFESFSQADASTTRRYGGTGLGLAISHRLVKAMRGTIGFDSEVGAGSTFWFEIPLTVGTTLPEQPQELLPDLLAGRRVLVVDDNATNRMILESQLRSWQLRADTVDSAAAALVQLRAMAARGEHYGIVVLDLCLPDLDGLRLAELVSSDAALSGTRMIMLTSSSEFDPASLRQAGVGEWLLKPVRSSDLYERLHRLVRTPQPAEPVRSPGRPPERSRPPARAPAQEGQRAAAPLAGRILVVEDNPLNQLVAQGLVATLGYAMDIVDDGAEALEAIRHTSYVAVLMDCHMPVLDGFEATRELRRREGGGRRLPVIAMTAGAMAADRDRCAAAGMDDFVSKPVTLAALRSALARLADAPAGDLSPSPAFTSGGPSGSGSVASPSVRSGWRDEPALDLSRITQLRQLGSMGGTDLLARVVRLFTRDAVTNLSAIREAVDSCSVTALHQALHKLKGAAANLGANRVAALCRELEDQTATNPAPGTDPRTTPGVRTVPGDALVTHQQLDLLEAELELANEAIARAV
jgi:hypothetical protein